MEKIIEIDGRQIPFKATGNTPRLYRVLFGRDIFKDIKKLSDDIQESQKRQEEEGTDDSYLDSLTLELFENIAYVMAKQADSNIPNIDEWLDGFSFFSIYLILPQILELWNLNMSQISESKKNIAELTAK